MTGANETNDQARGEIKGPEDTTYIQDLGVIFVRAFAGIGALIVIVLIIVLLKKYKCRCIRRG